MVFHNMLRFLFILSLGLMQAGAVPSALRALPSLGVTPYAPPKDEITRFFQQPRHDDYAIYEAIQQDKLGWMSFDFDTANIEGSPVLRMRETCEFNYRLQNVPFLQTSRQEMQFDPRPPYALRLASLEESLQKSRRTTVLQRTGPGEYRASITEAGETRTKEFSNLQLTALDRLGPRLWAIGKNLQRGDCQSFRAFDLKSMEPYLERYCIKSPASNANSPISVECEDMKNHFLSQWQLDPSGQVERLLIADSTLLVRLPRDEARQQGPTHDILTESLLHCYRPLGNVRKINSLEVHLSGTDFRTLPQTQRQQVTVSSTGNTAIIITGPARATPATPEEIKQNLAATIPVPCDDPRIERMAAKAIGNASTDAEKVRRILKYVSDFIADDDRIKTLSVFELLKQPRGDCTAHALLFTCLTRAAGIPCREASGYIYLGDETQTFGGHAWNEVVLDGAWHSVDPTWNQFTVDATHLQLSTGHPTPRDARFFNGRIRLTLP